jgi:uncharacterized protein YbjT (DUF2867 family)
MKNMSTGQRIIVTGAAGDQALAICQALTGAGHQVTGLTRSAERLPLINNTGATAALQPPAAGDVLVFSSTTDYREGVREAHARQVVAMAKAAGVRHIIFNAAADADDRLQRRVAQALRDLRNILQQESGLPVTTLLPTVYTDNLAQPWCLNGIRAGTLAYPIGPDVRVSWITHRSLGDFVAAAVAQFDGAASRTWRIGGPQALSLAEVAAILSERLQHNVAPVAIPIPAFRESLNHAFGPPAGDDIGDLYDFVAQHPDSLARQPADWYPLKVQPESVASWAARALA